MKILKPALILTKASFKVQTRSVVIFLLSFMSPLCYSVILITQIILNYHIVKNPFINISLEMYLLTFFVLQMIVFLTFDQSQRHVAKEILSGSFDYILLRPINLFYYKYFRVPSLMSVVMTIMYLTAIIITTIMYNIPVSLVVQLLLFVVFSSFIIINIRSGMRGLVFFKRDILNTTRVEESLNIFVINKPPEIFPIPIQIILTVFIPYIVVHNNAFEVLRGHGMFYTWTLTGIWILLAVGFNRCVWYYGLKRYESG